MPAPSRLSYKILWKAKLLYRLTKVLFLHPYYLEYTGNAFTTSLFLLVYCIDTNAVPCVNYICCGKKTIWGRRTYHTLNQRYQKFMWKTEPHTNSLYLREITEGEERTLQPLCIYNGIHLLIHEL